MPRVGLVALLSLVACGPPMTGPPPTPMAAGHRSEVGLAGGTNLLLVENGDSCEQSCVVFPDLQYWFRHQLSHHVDLGVTGFAGGTSVFGGGVAARFRFTQEESPFQLGLALDGGFYWVAGGVPLMWRIGQSNWITLTPSVGFRRFTAVQTNLGYEHQGDVLSIGGELGAGSDFSSSVTVEGHAWVGLPF